MRDNRQLLEQYRRTGDHQVFAELLARLLPMVYSVANRVLNGDRHAAEDVCQLVFSKLARRADSLPADVALEGWLHHDTYLTALSFVRSESRRKEREISAMRELPVNSEDGDWQSVRPVLDEVLNDLPPGERDVIVLRFFRRLSLNEIGERLQLGESGASRRLSRALESLRRLLAERGITTTASALGLTMTVNAGEAAPAHLAAKLMGIANVAPILTPASSSIILMATKFKVFVGSAVLIGIGIGIGVLNSMVGPAAEAHRGASEIRMAPATPQVGKFQLRRVSRPAAPLVEIEAASALEKLREVLFAPGRSQRHPSSKLEDALLALGNQRKLALPILREALQDPDWERRRRALGGIIFLGLGADGSEAVGDVLNVLRECALQQDAFLATTALETLIQSPLTDAETARLVAPDLVETIRENPVARMSVANLASTLVEPGTAFSAMIAEEFKGLLADPDPEVQATAARALAGLEKEGADDRVLKQALVGLASATVDDRVRGLTTLMNLGEGATNAIPNLRAFLARPQRADLRYSGQNFLEQLDPAVRQERAALEEERTQSFAAALQRGEATLDDALIALTDLPKAATAAAEAIGSLDINDFRDEPETVLGTVTLLQQVASGNLPLETRLAASHAYGRLQPTMPRPIYSMAELRNAIRAVEALLEKAPDHQRNAARAAWNGAIDREGWMWTNVYKRTGSVTDIPSANLAGFVQQIRTVDQNVHALFIAEMQKVDPNFNRHWKK